MDQNNQPLKLYIKNMVCHRCKMVVKAELEKLDLVTRDIPDDVFAAGNPCRDIRSIAQDPGEKNKS